MSRPRLHDDALHGLAGEVVRRLDPHTEADQAAVLASYLTGFGTIVGASPFIPVGGTKHGPRLFVVIVGATARARKGTSWADTRPILSKADAAIDSIVLGGFGS